MAILISLFFHLLIGFSLAAFGSALTPPLALEEKPVELTIVDSSPPDAPKPRDPPYLETAREKESLEKPKDQTFESNANSIGASELPAEGDLPLPTQKGVDRDHINLETHRSSLAMEGSQPEPDSNQIKQEEPQPKTSAAAKPVATEAPVSTPMATPEPEQLAMLHSTPPPPIDPVRKTEPSPPPIPEVAPPPPPKRRPETAASSYRPEREETRIRGSLNNRGPASVNAVGTPLGRYQKAVTDAIGSRWYYYMKAKMDLVSIGTARIGGEVDENGRVINLRVMSNSANEAFANICLQSFQEARIPPIPPDLIAALPEGRLPVEFSFTAYANR